MELILENVRCFYGSHKLPIRPLTFFVGENSSGKTTALAMLSFALTSSTYRFRPNFSEPPYDLGSFDTIATYRGGRGGRAKSFKLGFRKSEGEAKQRVPIDELVAEFIEETGQPFLTKVCVHHRDATLEVNIDSKRDLLDVTFQGEKISLDLSKDPFEPAGDWLPFIFFRAMEEIRKVKTDEPTERFFRNIFFGLRRLESPISLAPVRTKPRRTYDQIKDEFKPEGDHVPLVLARTFEASSEKGKLTLLAAMKKFGRDSGLYQSLKVKRLGKKPSDPFQVFITIAGPAANLQDVGYGVSQSLPIVVQSILAERGRRLIMQQPEVHLHPRAQAALGSLFVSLAMNDQKEFVIETHSDHIVDRVRQEVANGEIPHDMVQLLYFEKKGLEARVCPIELDELGNIVGAPDTYREFFMQEEMKLIMRGNVV